ncbi:KamA family radical SAM protein [Leptospira gomenensis]|uniref:KamA family radical SAM protein n=1 Tax=Leptospira gomenensis TaxID=2484974 RepID=A0A5F1Z282_9LEPT|nr:KamA family radical SAM protein [Leptospira gomenensis]TGK39362.1 KamA family radical SAM protein [Leptospira gomenensis]TGK44078.1 KamA family radical SAM protein [Leptospira gomenensis]TGK44303.1 KamA family radical SAM protein [Leptospira gomenensis]TGK65852.1 KamA family radical SAM protein [Leptospira gomenensis]
MKPADFEIDSTDPSFVSDIDRNRNELFSSFEWTDPKAQLQNRVKGIELDRYFRLTESERIGIRDTIRLNVSATPYYLSLSDPNDPNCPIRRMIVPRESESVFSPEESADPLHEERLSPVRGLTHMYPDRVLLFTNHECSVYCRHCMRGRKVSDSKERMTSEDLELCFEYIRSHPEIRDVVLSGGDPLNLNDTKIDRILENLESIEHVRICRLGTRNPVTLPFRITKELCGILESHNTDRLSIFCNTQFNHAKECTPEAKEAILRLLKAGVSVGNQCVLLKGVNDSGETMLELHKKLLEMRVRAYYMYDPELIPGSRGFRTPLAKGIEIVDYMRGKIAGMGIPSFVNDLPGGGGKITLGPDWYLGYYKPERLHVFRSALRGTYHVSSEPQDSTFEESYPEISSETWEGIRSSCYGVRGKLE